MILIRDRSNKYLGEVSFKNHEIVLTSFDNENLSILKKIFTEEIRESVFVRRGEQTEEKDGLLTCIIYLKQVKKDDPQYLVSVIEYLKDSGYRPLPLEGENLKIWQDIKEIDLSLDTKKGILENLENLSRQDRQKILDLLSKGKRKMAEIDKECQKKLIEQRKKQLNNWDRVLKEKEEQIMTLAKRD